MGDEPLGLLGEDRSGEVAEVVARGEHPVRAGEKDAAHAVVEPVKRRRDRVEYRVVERIALGRVGDRQAQDAVRRPVDEELAADGRQRSRRYSSTTSVSPSFTAWPSSQRISLTTPASSASTGISIFIDSRMTTVSPSSTCSPTSHSIFQTVPVMWASTSGTDVLLVGWARSVPTGVDGAWRPKDDARPTRPRARPAGYPAAVPEEPEPTAPPEP